MFDYLTLCCMCNNSYDIVYGIMTIFVFVEATEGPHPLNHVLSVSAGHSDAGLYSNVFVMTTG